ncbi:MAG: class I SAM-dependent methyltransferase [Acidimicrobiia bacterium]
MTVDFGKTATDYGHHRQGFPSSMFDRLEPFGIGLAGQRVVDVGTGTGTVAREFALRGCHVIGIDPSTALLEQAHRLDAEFHAEVDHRVGSAEATGLDDGSVDVLSAGQCWHWFDRPAAVSEAARVVVPGGHVVICHFDWLPLPGTVVEATEELILEHNPGWEWSGSTGVHPEWLRDLAGGPFTSMETFSYDVDVEYSHEAWRGRIRASAGVAASLPDDDVQRFDRAHRVMLDAQFPADPLTIPHRVWVLVATRV